MSFTKPVGTAAIDEGLVEVTALVRLGGASGVLVGQFTLVHNLAATGHATIPIVVVNDVSAGFDMTPEDLILGLALTPGASDDLTIEMVEAELVIPTELPV